MTNEKNEICYSWNDVYDFAMEAANQIYDDFSPKKFLHAYPIPTAGVPAAQAVVNMTSKIGIQLVENPCEADIYIDDVYDSGNTIKNIQKLYGHKPYYVLVHKEQEGIKDWVSFPWDRMKNDSGPEDNIRRILQHIGEDVEREGLLETPARVVRSYAELFSGYAYKTVDDFKDMVKVFEDGVCDEMVLLKNIEFVSMCEHHMLPFTGKSHIAYVPNGKLLGLSKLARILDAFSRRLQVQERLTQQVTEMIVELLNPKGAACIIEATHECMTCRGVRKQNAVMVTSSLKGVFLEKPEARAELFSLVKG